MTAADLVIHTYDIKEVHEDAGQRMQANEFFVYNDEEITVQEKMFRPARSTHFSIHLNLGNTLEIKYNLINYTVQKNSLFIIHPTYLKEEGKAGEKNVATLKAASNYFGIKK